MTTDSRHPRRALSRSLGALALGAGIAAAAGAAASRAEDRRVAQQASRCQTELASALEEIRQAQGEEIGRATALASMRAAVAHEELDATTFRDLLASEEWWTPFRGRLAVVVGPQGGLLDSEPRAQALLDPGLVARARAQAPVSDWVGVDEVIAAAAAPIPLGGRKRPGPHLLLLGRPIDRPLAQALARRLSLSLQVASGGRALLFAGDERRRATLTGLAGSAGAGPRVDRQQGWLAVPVSLGGARVVWGLRELAVQPWLNPWLPRSLLALALLVGALALLVGTRGRAVTRAPAPPASGASGAAGGEQPTVLREGQVFGRYTLLERIGEGGMAELFLAALSGAEGFRRLYVIKRLKPQIAHNPAAVDQFIDEAKLSSLLVHSNIVPVFDFGKVGSGYFLAQEYIAGRTLAQLVVRHIERLGEPLDPGTVLHIAQQVLEALAYAHERVNDEGRWLGIVHRDVSSSNIMVTGQGEVKLFDFGIVSAVERVSSTELGRIKGNAAFMSPEQARGQPVDARSDLFSLGLVIYAALTGETLYGAQNPTAAFYEATAGLTADHLARIRALPAPAPAILEKALAMDPDRRYRSARDFAEALAPGTAQPKAQLATLMNALFGEDLRQQAAAFRSKLGAVAGRGS